MVMMIVLQCRIHAIANVNPSQRKDGWLQVLKKDWPARWPTFISELVGASKTSENLCENSMHILRLLSEEVFDFNRGELTQAKTRMLKAQLNTEFSSIYDLCHYVLRSTDLWEGRQSLIKATLSTLQVRRWNMAPGVRCP